MEWTKEVKQICQQVINAYDNAISDPDTAIEIWSDAYGSSTFCLLCRHFTLDPPNTVFANSKCNNCPLRGTMCTNTNMAQELFNYCDNVDPNTYDASTFQDLLFARRDELIEHFNSIGIPVKGIL